MKVASTIARKALARRRAAAAALVPLLLACASVAKVGGQDPASVDQGSGPETRVRGIEPRVDYPSLPPEADSSREHQGMEALPGRTCVPVLSYAQQRWYDPRTGRFLSEDPVGATDERLMQPGRMHTFGYAAGNPLLYVDPLGLDAGQVDSTSARAQEDMAYQAGRNDNNKDRGNWAQGCAAGFADNWKNVDGGAMEAGTHSPEYLAGYMRCQGANLDSYRNSAIAKNTREFWTATPERAGAMGCVLGGGSALSPVGGDVNNLPSNMQSSAAACQFGVGAATAVMTAGELGVSGYRALKNFRPPPGPAPAFAGISSEARGVAAAEEASAAERMPGQFKTSKRGDAPGITRSEHAKLRASQGKPVGAATRDVRDARSADVFVQGENGRFVVRGRGGREHIIDPSGELVTSLERPKAAHLNRLRNGTIRPVTPEEFDALKGLLP